MPMHVDHSKEEKKGKSKTKKATDVTEANMSIPASMHEMSRPENVTIDVTEAQISKYKVGQKIEMVIKGTVQEIRMPSTIDSKWDKPSIRIEVNSKDVKGNNEYEKMAMDDERDEEEEQEDKEKG